MSNKETNAEIVKEVNSTIKNNNLWWIILACMIIIIVFNWIYIGQLGSNLSDNASDFEAYGSYIGGVLGSIFTFISIIVLVITLKNQNVANSSNIKLLSKQLDEQKNNHEDNIIILRNQLEEERKSNELSISLLQKQIIQSKDHYEKTTKFNIIKSQVENIKLILDDRITGNDLYTLLDNNNKLAEKMKFTSFTEADTDIFIEQYDNKVTFTIVHLLKNFSLSKIDITKLTIPNNIDVMISNLKMELHSLVLILSQYFDHEISHSILVSTLKYVFEPNIMLRKIKSYNEVEVKSVFSYLESIRADSFYPNYVKISKHSYREVKELIFYYMLSENKDNIADKRLTYPQFANIYSISTGKKENSYIVQYNSDNREVLEIDLSTVNINLFK